jgi:hypothetical protein
MPANTFTCSSLYIHVNTGAVGANARILIYSDNNGTPGTKTYESVNLSCSTTGVKSVATAQTFVAGTTYWLGVYNSATIAYIGFPTTALLPITTNFSFAVTQFFINSTFGSAPTTFGTPTFLGGNAPLIGITI